jgi:hypothetical protein
MRNKTEISAADEGRQFKMRAKVWLYSGKAAWHFITLPKKQSAEIKAQFGMMKKGWGSLPVTVTIGNTSWKTSIFPDERRGAYLLPIKADVRKKENISAGETIEFLLEVRV